MVKDLEKYLWKSSLLSKVASCIPTVLLKTNSFTGKEPFNNEWGSLGVCWGLTFCYEAFRKNKSRWGFILSTSYVTPTIFKICIFQWCIRLFPLDVFYTAGVRSDLGWNNSNLSQFTNSPNKTYLRRSQGFLDVIWTLYLHSIIDSI